MAEHLMRIRDYSPERSLQSCLYRNGVGAKLSPCQREQKFYLTRLRGNQLVGRCLVNSLVTGKDTTVRGGNQCKTSIQLRQDVVLVTCRVPLRMKIFSYNIGCIKFTHKKVACICIGDGGVDIR